MLLREPFYQRNIFVAVIIRAVGHLLLHLFQSGLHSHIIRKGLARFFPYGSVVLKFHHLRKISDRGVVGNGNDTVRRLLKAAEDFQHGGFPGTILPDERYSVAVVHDKADIDKQWFYTKFNL